MRLAQLAKNRVKLVDFTNKDKFHILDLFVNNEKTLLKVYEALFPHRTVSNAEQPQTLAAGVNIGYPIIASKERGTSE